MDDLTKALFVGTTTCKNSPVRTLEFTPKEPTPYGELRWHTAGGFSKGADNSKFAWTSLEAVFLYEITHLLDGTYEVYFCDTIQSLGVAGSFEEATAIVQAHFEATVGCFLKGVVNE